MELIFSKKIISATHLKTSISEKKFKTNHTLAKLVKLALFMLFCLPLECYNNFESPTVDTNLANAVY